MQLRFVFKSFLFIHSTMYEDFLLLGCEVEGSIEIWRVFQDGILGIEYCCSILVLYGAGIRSTEKRTN